jgi:3'-5' exoribonuclease
VLSRSLGEQVVATFRAGDAVDGVFACTRKERLIARSGNAYLALELRDRSGAIEARVFRDADLLAGRFERGEVVRAAGRVARYRDELSLELERIARVPEGAVDAAAFLPVAYRDLDELDGFLEHLSREVADPGYRRLLDALLGDDALREQWRRAPCTRAGHHAYLGGLLEHTVAVATLAQELALQHPRLNSDLLLCAAIVHDIGKTEEFTYGATIELSEQGRLIGHVQLGLRLLERRGARLLDDGRMLALAHCVLCHHGPEAAPGRRFAGAEALALYRLNALDASVKDALEHGRLG